MLVGGWAVSLLLFGCADLPHPSLFGCVPFPFWLGGLSSPFLGCGSPFPFLVRPSPLPCWLVFSPLLLFGGSPLPPLPPSWLDGLPSPRLFGASPLPSWLAPFWVGTSPSSLFVGKKREKKRRKTKKRRTIKNKKKKLRTTGRKHGKSKEKKKKKESFFQKSQILQRAQTQKDHGTVCTGQSVQHGWKSKSRSPWTPIAVRKRFRLGVVTVGGTSVHQMNKTRSARCCAFDEYICLAHVGCELVMFEVSVMALSESDGW